MANKKTLFATLRGDPLAIGILCFALTIIVGLWVVLEAQIKQERASKISDVMRENSNLARAFEEHTIRTLEYIDGILLALQTQYSVRGRNFDLQKFYAGLKPNAAVLRNVVITDETGLIVLSTPPAPRISLADREHVKVHASEKSNQLFISRPILARVNRQWSLIATRRVSKPGGALAGVVGVAIDPAYFSNFYRELDLGTKGIVTLVGADGIVRARLARNNLELGQNIAQAVPVQRLVAQGSTSRVTYVAKSAVDQIERIYASQRVHGYPLLVFVGTSTGEALAGVTSRANTYRLAMAFATVLIGGLAMLLVAFNLRRSQAQSLIREAGERTSGIIDASMDAIVSLDANERIAVFNPAAARIFKLSAAQARGRKFEDLIPARFHSSLSAWVRESMPVGTRSQKPGRFSRLSALRADGSEFPVEVSLSRHADGAAYTVTVTLRDISEREQAHAALARSSELLQRTSEITKTGGWELELPGKQLYWSPETCRIHDIDYPVAHGLEQAIKFYAPEARPTIAAAVEAGIVRGTSYDLELPLITASGRSIWVRTRGSAMMQNGKAVKLYGVVQDITERKQANLALREGEERFRTLVESVPVGVNVYRDGRILYCNPAALRMLGATPADDLIGKSFLDIVHPDFHDLARARVHDVTSVGVSAPMVRMQFLRRNGTAIDVEAQATAIVYDGAPTVYGVWRDISERIKSEAAHELLEAQLRESQKMQAIGTLAGGIAHDFNNIIANILGNVELASEDAGANPIALQSLGEIRKAGVRARDLVQQILAFSRRQATARTSLSLSPVLRESVRLLRATLPARISIELDCDDVLPAVLADATQIQQVVINLASNSMQAMAGARGRILIRCDTVMLDGALVETHPALHALHERRPGRTLRLAVSDDGPGMNAATLARMFEPFFTTKPVGEGTGLGLSVVHGIVLTHEGSITVESQPGQGSTFTLYLPIAGPGTGASAPLAHAVPAPAVTLALPRPGCGEHILYLDDDDALVDLVKRLLERRGYRVSGYTESRKALAALRHDPASYDFLITDYNMPGMSGVEVAREVHAIRTDLPVAVASGFVDEDLHTRAAAVGVRAVIYKATEFAEFCTVIQRMMQVSEEPGNCSE